jgi:hypothetical protein
LLLGKSWPSVRALPSRASPVFQNWSSYLRDPALTKTFFRHVRGTLRFVLQHLSPQLPSCEFHILFSTHIFFKSSACIIAFECFALTLSPSFERSLLSTALGAEFITQSSLHCFHTTFRFFQKPAQFIISFIFLSRICFHNGFLFNSSSEALAQS